jgi:hypothetical protein
MSVGYICTNTSFKIRARQMYNTGDLLKEWRTAYAAADVEVRYLCECRNVREALLVEEWRRLCWDYDCVRDHVMVEKGLGCCGDVRIDLASSEKVVNRPDNQAFYKKH